MPGWLAQTLLPASAVLCLAVLALRFRLLPPDKRKRSAAERLRFVKALAGALLALLAVSGNLKRLLASLDR